ncbi:putative FAD-binding protein C17H9.12c [Beauveria bassiana]|nr:putative FAD-binding protein C17H9.12c [Beauveria bassiana]
MNGPRRAIGACACRLTGPPTLQSLPYSSSSTASCTRQLSTRRPFKGPSRHQGLGKRPLLARALNPAVAAILLIGGSAVYYLTTPSSREKVLNQDTFVPYTITSREAISATSFIFTVAPQHPNPSPSFLTAAADPSKPAAWRYPLWSVEFKQPEVQIARNYTPLPPLQGERLEDGKLRFYVRSIPGGEMSTYLGRLGVGRQVWLRGTHPGFDVATRLGSQKNVVFLAGGTGVAPAMQVARAVLDSREDANFTLLWAIRSREELQQAPDAPDKRPVSSSWWNWFRGTPRPQPTQVGHPITGASPLGRQLDEMKARYGDRLRIHVGVDDESSQFRESHIADVIQSSAAAPTLPSAPDCQPHNQKFHAPASEFEPNGARPCTCETGSRGKNLLMVSGPEGFISHYAGPKVWLGGVETQGAVGGVAAELRRRNSGFAAGWLVLKL